MLWLSLIPLALAVSWLGSMQFVLSPHGERLPGIQDFPSDICNTQEQGRRWRQENARRRHDASNLLDLLRHNCYSYAMGWRSPRSRNPGFIARGRLLPRPFTKEALLSAVRADLRYTRDKSYARACALPWDCALSVSTCHTTKGSSKRRVFGYLRNDGMDFHFIVQENITHWYHKLSGVPTMLSDGRCRDLPPAHPDHTLVMAACVSR